ncbi:SpoIID/LytB domain-containing protein [Oscillatoriales cyanobacterium LEGE 11467]|uniref:SpoIID/LytB domain-containing protein n=1 Tax=Zarconia navalis LEGE 11467 TaxID=1828826 RepID=A0A928Z8P3_9CYAN|nr:SpoIID/LytB domain-containing protein [Zarconia navalis]MBE9040883.1 SpoIID/LytB domain-containing protein [Zarconia navalis LEGE 11467]
MTRCDRRQGKRQRWSLWLTTLLSAGCWVGSIPEVSWAQNQQTQDIELQVGIVQRFGDEPTDELTLEAPEGDRLTLTFTGGDGTPQIQQTEKLKIQIASQAQLEPTLEERIVLSNHRSFESAEETAAVWKARGIEVEIAQPDRWQVWAKPDVYSTPFLRRWLLQSLKNQGYDTIHFDSRLKSKKPQAYWVLDGYRYNRDRFEIASGTGVVRVKEGKDKDEPFHTFGGSFNIQPNAHGDYTLVNRVPLETYLRGVVPYEIGAFAPEGALQAQAIVARTYALRNLRRFAADDYQLCATVDCQVYKGLEGTDAIVDRAIAATAGQVLTYNNELADTLYSASTGGVTAPFNDVWNGPPRPYLTAVVDSVSGVWDLANNTLADEANFRRFVSLKKGFNEEEVDTFRWQEGNSLKEIAQFLKYYLEKNNRPANFNTVSEVKVVDRSHSGRVLKMVVQTDTGPIEIPNDEIRNAFYPPISTFFYLEPIYKEEEKEEDSESEKEADNMPKSEKPKILSGYTFVGGGFGHGVGMSQSGASQLAESGWSSDRILEFYYPGTELVPVNESIVFWQEPQ